MAKRSETRIDHIVREQNMTSDKLAQETIEHAREV